MHSFLGYSYKVQNTIRCGATSMSVVEDPGRPLDVDTRSNNWKNLRYRKFLEPEIVEVIGIWHGPVILILNDSLVQER